MKKTYDLVQRDGKIAIPLDDIDRITINPGEALLVAIDPSMVKYQHTIGQAFEKALPGVPIVVYPKHEIEIKKLSKGGLVL